MLVKQNPDLIWPFFIAGGPSENINNRQMNAPLSNLTSQIEECDFGLNGHDGENEFFIGLYSIIIHKIVNLDQLSVLNILCRKN